MTDVSTRWVYNGDANVEHGGAWIDISTWEHGYCSAVRVTDLDSGCGFDGACLIEHIIILGMDDPKRIREALRSCGCSARGFTKEAARHMIADALMSYGHFDPDDGWDGYHTPWYETVQTQADGPMSFDGWKAAKRLHNTDLREYIESVHLG